MRITASLRVWVIITCHTLKTEANKQTVTYYCSRILMIPYSSELEPPSQYMPHGNFKCTNPCFRHDFGTVNPDIKPRTQSLFKQKQKLCGTTTEISSFDGALKQVNMVNLTLYLWQFGQQYSYYLHNKYRTFYPIISKITSYPKNCKIKQRHQCVNANIQKYRH